MQNNGAEDSKMKNVQVPIIYTVVSIRDGSCPSENMEAIHHFH